ncbi:MAG: 50S ribosomal protein L19 [Dehalococcoidia bacterium]|nr:50S ribosomal protein L19 [Dehalococcoidia bacterium]MSQ34536.1 50S ribosomal protein L19 [Dehalococcoidia bacterium]
MDARELIAIKPASTIDAFRPGDTVIVNVKIREGERERLQAFQGAVIIGSYTKESNPAPGVTFTVRRVSYGIGVERIFPVCSPMIESVKVTRKGNVRRARLVYLRGLTGKAARIKEQRYAPSLPVAEGATAGASVQAVAEVPVAAVIEPVAVVETPTQPAAGQKPA